MGRNVRPPSPSVVIGEGLAGIALLGGAAIAGYALIQRPWANRIDAAGFTAFPEDQRSLLYHRIADVGSLPFLLGGIALAIVLSIWRDWPRAAACLIGPIAAVVTTEQVAKPLVGRHLVVHGGNSYPSGTVTAAAALVTVVALASPLLLRPIVALGGVGIIGAVGIAVVGMRWHFPTDAIGGACVGIGAVLTLDAVAHLPRSISGHRSGHRSPDDPVYSYLPATR